mmetsp:Transcript_54533/g.177232  ORF Transcript_54533/g.177232 Transcript_54533/m.177232 type:complete len:213 (+) Transcript_54533:717-1355(+)
MREDPHVHPDGDRRGLGLRRCGPWRGCRGCGGRKCRRKSRQSGPRKSRLPGGEQHGVEGTAVGRAEASAAQTRSLDEETPLLALRPFRFIRGSLSGHPDLEGGRRLLQRWVLLGGPLAVLWDILHHQDCGARHLRFRSNYSRGSLVPGLHDEVSALVPRLLGRLHGCDGHLDCAFVRRQPDRTESFDLDVRHILHRCDRGAVDRGLALGHEG